MNFLSRALSVVLLLLAVGPMAGAAIGNPSPPPPSGTWSVGPNDQSDTIVGTVSTATHYRVKNNGPGTVHVQPRNKNGNKVGDGYDVDPGDSVDVELLRDQHLDVENTDEGPGGDDDLDASGTYDRL